VTAAGHHRLGKRFAPAAPVAGAFRASATTSGSIFAPDLSAVGGTDEIRVHPPLSKSGTLRPPRPLRTPERVPVDAQIVILVAVDWAMTLGSIEIVIDHRESKLSSKISSASAKAFSTPLYIGLETDVFFFAKEGRRAGQHGLFDLDHRRKLLIIDG